MSLPTRRERARDATVAEIKATARGLLVREGADAITVRAVAREMGLTPPALYRYVDGHEGLVRALCHDVLAEITVTLEAARDAVPADQPVERLLATCRAFREWSLSHPREFQLTFASMRDRPLVGPEELGSDVDPGISFGAVFLDVFVDIWHQQPFRVPREEELPPALLDQLEAFSVKTGAQLPVGVLVAYLAGWVRLFGGVTLEVFGHLGFALADPAPMFEAMLADMRRQLSEPPLGSLS